MTTTSPIRPMNLWRISLLSALTLSLGGCEAFSELGLFDRETGETVDQSGAPLGEPLQLVQRDVETPSAFSVTDKAIWDGRPSLGGIWVAYPGNVQPERVNIRNETTGETVVGALFKRERQNPGPPIQVSSDAANALGIVPGSPIELSIIALRREAVNANPAPVVAAKTPDAEPEVEVVSIPDTEKTPVGAKPSPRKTGTTIAAAVASVQTPQAPAAAKPVVAADTGFKSYIQVGVFSLEDNANKLARRLTDAGVLSQARTLDAGTKVLYRVVAGPAANAAELKSNMAKIKAQGFKDAYIVAR